MVLDRAGMSERRGAAHNPQLLAPATRLRVLRLEHHPQPDWTATLTRNRGFLGRRRPGGRGRLVSLDVLRGRRPIHQDTVASSGAVFGLPAKGFEPRVPNLLLRRANRLPERGKSRFATVSNTYIRPGEGIGKRCDARLSRPNLGILEAGAPGTGPHASPSRFDAWRMSGV